MSGYEFFQFSGEFEEKSARWSVSRVLFLKNQETAIHLGCPLPNTSCNRPGQQAGNPRASPKRCGCPYLVLLRVGFTVPPPLPDARCALTAPFHPYPFRPKPCGRFAFCGTFPKVAPAGRYPAPCFHGARTFLSQPKLAATVRPSGHPSINDMFIKNNDLGVSRGNAGDPACR